MRIRPPECGEPFAPTDCGEDTIRIANRGPNEKSEFEAREIIDGGFLELVRYGVRAADDPVIVESLKVVDAVLKRDTPEGALAGAATTTMVTGKEKTADHFWATGRDGYGRC